MGTYVKHPLPDRVKPSFVIFDIRTLTLSPERQGARMSKITNDRLTRCGTGCFLAAPIIMATVEASKVNIAKRFIRTFTQIIKQVLSYH